MCHHQIRTWIQEGEDHAEDTYGMKLFYLSYFIKCNFITNMFLIFVKICTQGEPVYIVRMSPAVSLSKNKGTMHQ